MRSIQALTAALLRRAAPNTEKANKTLIGYKNGFHDEVIRTIKSVLCPAGGLNLNPGGSSSSSISISCSPAVHHSPKAPRADCC